MAKEQSFGETIIESLKEFLDDIKKGKSIEVISYKKGKRKVLHVKLGKKRRSKKNR